MKISLILICFGSLVSAAVSSIDIEEKRIEFELDVKRVGSSNPLALETGEASGYFEITPAITYNPQLSEKLWMQSSLEGSSKFYDKSIISNSGKQNRTGLAVGLTSFLSPSHELGTSVAAKSFDGRSLDYDINVDGTGGFSSSGRASRYNQIYGDIYYDYLTENANYELLFSQTKRDYLTLSEDEQLNEFNNSYVERGVFASTSVEIINGFKLGFMTFFSDRDYDSKPAKNTDGGILSSNPVSRENQQGATVSFGFEQKFEAKLKLNIGRTRDRIWGAEDTDNRSGKLEIKYPVASDFVLLSDFTLSHQGYLNHAADPVNPTNGDKRNDSTQTTKFGLQFPLFSQRFQVNYYDFKKSSTYKVFGASYTEQKLEASIKITL